MLFFILVVLRFEQFYELVIRCLDNFFEIILCLSVTTTICLAKNVHLVVKILFVLIIPYIPISEKFLICVIGLLYTFQALKDIKDHEDFAFFRVQESETFLIQYIKQFLELLLTEFEPYLATIKHSKQQVTVFGLSVVRPVEFLRSSAVRVTQIQ